MLLVMVGVGMIAILSGRREREGEGKRKGKGGTKKVKVTYKSHCESASKLETLYLNTHHEIDKHRR